MTRAAKIADRLVGSNIDFFFYLYDRWQDKGKYERKEDYEEAIERRIGCPVELITDPWGFKFEVDGKMFVLKLNNQGDQGDYFELSTL